MTNEKIATANKDKCRSCDGSGRKVYHGAFFSKMGNCGFCGGTGLSADENNWYDKSFKSRGLT